MKINHQSSSSILQKTAVKKTLLVVFSIFLISAYIWNLNGLAPNVHGDEGEAALQSLKLLYNNTGLIGVGWSDLPLFSFVPHAVGIILLGPTIAGDRIGAAVFGIGSIFILYLFVKEFFEKRVAILSVIFLSTSHMWIATSRSGLPTSQAAFCLLLSLYFALRGVKKHEMKYFILAGISSGISMYSYYPIRILPILLSLLFLFYIFQKHNLKQKIRNIFFFFIAGFLVFLPQGIFYLNNSNAFSSRSDTVFVFSEIGKNWSNYNDKNNAEILFIQTKKTLNIFNGDNSTQYGYKGHLVDIFSLVFILIGIVYSLIHLNKFKHLFILFWFSLALVGQILTTIPPPIFLPRFVVGIPVLFLFAAIGAAIAWRNLSFKPIIRNVLFILVFAFIALYNLKIYFIDFPTQISKGIAGGGIHELTPRKISDFINSYPRGHNFYFLTKPNLSADYGTIKFLARGSSRFEIDPQLEPIQIPSINTNSSFILYPEYEEKIKDIQNKYPNGELKRYTNYFKETEFITYTVNFN